MKMEKIFYEKVGMSFAEYYKLKYNYLLNYVRQSTNKKLDFESIVNDSFMKLLTYINNFNSELASVDTYLFTIARNRVNYEFRDNKITLIPIETYFGVSEVDDREEYDISIDLHFESFLERLNELGYNELKLSLLEYSYQEIADELGINLGKVKNRIHFQKKKVGMVHKVNITDNPNYDKIAYQKHKKKLREMNKVNYYNNIEKVRAYNKAYREKKKNEK